MRGQICKPIDNLTLQGMIGRPQRSFVRSDNMLCSLTFQSKLNSSHRLIRKFGDVPDDLNACEVSVRFAFI